MVRHWYNKAAVDGTTKGVLISDGCVCKEHQSGGHSVSNRDFFWMTYGCCVPDLKELALALSLLGYGSGCAKRNWTACKSVLNNRHNCLDKN